MLLLQRKQEDCLAPLHLPLEVSLANPLQPQQEACSVRPHLLQEDCLAQLLLHPLFQPCHHPPQRQS